VLVADFGLLGSPAYMAPEQLQGAPPSAAADQFALCVALFEALTSHRPFAGDSIAALQRSIRRGGVAPAMHRLPRWLQGVLGRGLAVDPEQRFPSLAALLSALDPRRRSVRWPFAAVAVAAVALAVVPTTRARPSAGEVEAIEAFEIESETLRAAEQAFARGRLPEAREQARIALANAQASGNEATTAAALVIRGRIEALTGPLDIALGSLDDAYALGIASGATGITVDAAIEMSELLAADAERFDEAAKWTRHAEVALQRHGDDPHRASSLAAAVATLDSSRERFDDARRGFERVLEGYAQRNDVDVATIAYTKSNLGVVLAKMGAEADAIRTHEAALQLLEDAGLESHYVYGRVMLDLANAESRMRRYEQAREHNERALALFTDALGPDAIMVGRAAFNLGSAEVEIGNIDAAALAIEHGEAVLTRALGPDHPAIANVLVGLASVDLQRGQPLPARDRLERAAGILERAHGLDHIALVPILGNLGNIAASLRDAQASQRHFAKSIEVLERVHGPEHPSLAPELENLANTVMAMGDLDEAERLLARSYAIRSKNPPARDPSLFLYWLAIAKLHVERGRLDLADTALDQAALLAEDRARRSVVELVRGEVRWRAGHRKRAIAMVRRAKQTLAEDPSQMGLSNTIDDWLAATVGSAK
jgi:tetratricopeptide (TPR) repeat protein